jgi:D-allose transport system permease protein
VISDANSVYGFSFDFVNFFAASVLGIPVPVIFSLIVAVILVSDHPNAAGRNIYALGGNKNSAFYSGIDVKFHILVVFIISGVAPGWRAWSQPRAWALRNRWPGWVLKPTPLPAPLSAAPASSVVRDAFSRW